MRPPLVIRTLVGAGVALVVAAGPAVASPFGINAHIPPDEVLDALAAAGIGWVRLDIRWPLVQPEPDSWDFSLYDHVVEAARTRGLQIYGTLVDSPAWATAGPPGAGPPRDPRDWARFCFRTARRYRGRVAAWGLWNEPNLKGFWAGSRRDYIDLVLLPGARAIHAADPEALVCAPDTAHLHSADWEGWLRDVIAAAGNELDVVTHHVYPSGASHETVTSALERDAANPWDDPSVKKVLQRSGWFGRPFWLTETGLASNRYGLDDQAGFYTNLLEDWFRPGTDLNWVDRIFFYEAADDPEADAYGILGPPPGYEAKPAYAAYADFIAQNPEDDAEVTSVELPAFIVPGTAASGSITVRNTGTTTWSREAGHTLLVVEAPAGLEVDGLELPAGAEVDPGGEAGFQLTLHAPLAERTGPLVLRMAHDGRRLFGAPARRTVTLTFTAPPVIDRGPEDRAVRPGGVVSFSVQAHGPWPLVYRWQLDGADLQDGPHFMGSGGPRLTVVGVTAAETGVYRCLVQNQAGTVASPEAVLRLDPAAPPRRPAGRPPSAGAAASSPGKAAQHPRLAAAAAMPLHAGRDLR